jgi:hypothetical protein
MLATCGCIKIYQTNRQLIYMSHKYYPFEIVTVCCVLTKQHWIICIIFFVARIVIFDLKS